jgi:acyl carrier protein
VTPAPILSQLITRPSPAASAGVRARILAEGDRDRRRRLLVDHLRDQVAEALQVDRRSIDPRVPVGDLGVDSFAAIELRDRLERTLDFTLSATMFWNYPTLEALSGHLDALLGGPTPAEGRTDESDDNEDLAAVLEAAAALDEGELQPSEEVAPPADFRPSPRARP